MTLIISGKNIRKIHHTKEKRVEKIREIIKYFLPFVPVADRTFSLMNPCSLPSLRDRTASSDVSIVSQPTPTVFQRREMHSSIVENFWVVTTYYRISFANVESNIKIIFMENS